MNNKKCPFLKIAVSLFLLSSYVQAENLIRDGSMEESPLEDVSAWKLISTTTQAEKVKEGVNSVLHVVTSAAKETDSQASKFGGVRQPLRNIQRPTSLKVSFRYKVANGKSFGVAVGNSKYEKVKRGLNATEWEKFEHVFDLTEMDDVQKTTTLYFTQNIEHPTEFYLDDVSVEVIQN